MNAKDGVDCSLPRLLPEIHPGKCPGQALQIIKVFHTLPCALAAQGQGCEPPANATAGDGPQTIWTYRRIGAIQGCRRTQLKKP
jgi:hypothetical protein